MTDTETAVCKHRWRIAEPDGRAKLPGVCGHCGAFKDDFVAGADFMRWEDFKGRAVDQPSIRGSRWREDSF